MANAVSTARSKTVKNEDSDFYKVKDDPADPKNYNICHIRARAKSKKAGEPGPVVGEADVKVPKLAAPYKVWEEYCSKGNRNGELELKAKAMRQIQVELRSSLKSKKSSAARGGMASALS